MNTSTLLAELCADFQARYAAHTILLYGSQADGTASPDSDMDIAAFAPVSSPIRGAYMRDSVFIDAFVYPESVLDDPAEEHLRFRGSKILIQRAGTADAFLARLDQKHTAGPTPLAGDERDARLDRKDARTQPSRRCRRRLSQGVAADLTARRLFRSERPTVQGPKKALIWLRENDPQTSDAMERALKPDADIAAIEKAAERALDGE